MPNDPGITDQCLSIMANATDVDGTHHADGQFWLSPDVVMTGADPGLAHGGVDNTTNVTVHWKSGCSLAVPAVVFDLYVCTPSLLITTTPTSSVQLAASKVVAGIAAGGSVTTPVHWTPVNDATKPNGPGHRCLIARCYPFGLTPDPTNLSTYVPDDKHYAQHNLTVDVGAGAQRQISIHTGNPGNQQERFAIHAVQDLHPSPHVLRAIQPALKATGVFKRFSTVTARNLTVDLKALSQVQAQGPIAHLQHPAQAGQRDLPSATKGVSAQPIRMVSNVVKNAATGLFGTVAHPNLEAAVTVHPRAFTTFSFHLDVSGTKSGDAGVFHVTQTNSKGHIVGGLTVLAVTQ